jgi:hypothetical protein
MVSRFSPRRLMAAVRLIEMYSDTERDMERIAMTSLTSILKSLSLAWLVFGFAVAAPTASGQRPSASQIRVKREAANQGVILSEYLDQRTGRTVIVKAGTSQDLALGWLGRLSDTKLTATEQDLTAIVTSGHAQGLIAVGGGFAGTSVTVSWGPPPRREPPANTIVSTLMDQRTGAMLVIGPNVTSAQEWFVTLNAAKSEADLFALLTARHPQGLLAATTRINGGVKVTTFWSPGPK